MAFEIKGARLASDDISENDILSYQKEIKSICHNYLHNHMATVCRDLGIESYNAYLMLLAFGSVNYSVEECFLGEISDITCATIDELVLSGLASYSGHGKIVLNVHPFQVRQIINAIEMFPEKHFANKWFFRKNITAKNPPSIVEAMFMLFLSEPTSEEDKIIRFN